MNAMGVNVGRHEPEQLGKDRPGTEGIGLFFKSWEDPFEGLDASCQTGPGMDIAGLVGGDEAVGGLGGLHPGKKVAEVFGLLRPPEGQITIGQGQAEVIVGKEIAGQPAPGLVQGAFRPVEIAGGKVAERLLVLVAGDQPREKQGDQHQQACGKGYRRQRRQPVVKAAHGGGY
jgi:hypothetical protein